MGLFLVRNATGSAYAAHYLQDLSLEEIADVVDAKDWPEWLQASIAFWKGKIVLLGAREI